MTHHNDHRTTKAEHATHFTIENAASLCTVFTLDIDSFVVKRHIVQTLYVILSEMTDDTIGSCNRHR